MVVTNCFQSKLQRHAFYRPGACFGVAVASADAVLFAFSLSLSLSLTHTHTHNFRYIHNHEGDLDLQLTGTVNGSPSAPAAPGIAGPGMRRPAMERKARHASAALHCIIVRFPPVPTLCASSCPALSLDFRCFFNF